MGFWTLLSTILMYRLYGHQDHQNCLLNDILSFSNICAEQRQTKQTARPVHNFHSPLLFTTSIHICSLLFTYIHNISSYYRFTTSVYIPFFPYVICSLLGLIPTFPATIPQLEFKNKASVASCVWRECGKKHT